MSSTPPEPIVTVEHEPQWLIMRTPAQAHLVGCHADHAALDSTIRVLEAELGTHR